jgi:hypothetical protein
VPLTDTQWIVGPITVSRECDIANEVALLRAEETALKTAIVEHSHLYFGIALVTIVSYVVGAFAPAWLRWITGFLLAALLVGELGMVALLRRLQQFHAPFRTDIVVRNHLFMGIVALMALVYALLGLWSRWPLPWLAMAFAVLINLLHGVGYSKRNSSHG